MSKPKQVAIYVRVSTDSQMLLNSGPCITSRVSTDSGVGDSLAAYAISLPPTAKMRETVSWEQELPCGNGILVDYNVARFFVDTEALYSYQGTYQMQHLINRQGRNGIQCFPLIRIVKAQKWSSPCPNPVSYSLMASGLMDHASAS